MSTLASLKTEVAQAACFKCLPVNYQEAIKAYLLAVRAGGSLDPKTLLAQARGFNGVQSGVLPSLQAAFADVAAGRSGDISVSISQNKCDVTCLTAEDGLAMQIVALASNLSLAAIPKTLARLAACFICIPPGKLIMLQTYLTGVISGLISVPPTVPGTSIPIGPPPIIPTPIMRFAIRNAGYPPQFFQAFMDRAIYVWPPGPGGGGGGTGTIDPLTTSWQTRAIANGGTPTQATLACLNTFCVGIRPQTYFAKLKSVNFLAPDDFRCAMTPLIVHAQDTGLWLGQSGPYPAGGNVFVSAINAQLGALGIRCDYPYTPNPGTDNYNSSAIFASRTSWGVTIYTTTNDGLHGPQGFSWGGNDAAGNFNQGTNNAGGSTTLFADDAATGFSQAFSFYGYYSFNVSGANTRIVYAANSTNPHALFMSSVAALGGNLCTNAFGWAGVNNNGPAAGGTSNWHSFLALHDPLTQAESLDFYTRIQALRVCLGTGFV